MSTNTDLWCAGRVPRDWSSGLCGGGNRGPADASGDDDDDDAYDDNDDNDDINDANNNNDDDYDDDDDQIVASLYPVQFLELVVMRPAYYACIGLELCGFTHFCWVLAAGMARLFRMKKEAGTVVVQVEMTFIISKISIISIISNNV